MRLSRMLFALVAPLILTGCFLSPGKFSSQMQLMSDGSFAYSYEGEIQFLAMSKLAEMGSKADQQFEPEECYTDDFEERECTPAEISQQREEWREGAAERMASKTEEAEQMKLLMGGIDPSDPEAAAQFAAKLERQRGWNKVIDKGDGIFDVSFAMSGQLSHDFLFPNIESLPMGSAFVNLYLRDEGKVRIEAPGFAAQGAGNPMQGMMGGMMNLAKLDGGKDGEGIPNLVVPEGTFTIITDGLILANNTDEGPQVAATGQALVWQISPQTESAPTALIQF
ncbi:hypothetical protein [Altererythrobacter sp. MF3-039]|uniref:hypothetical protein n=1 Tax=Altererythrobacter sp. MF3-039 TaxID=3252901 RepID=UPI00390C9010